MVPIVQVKVQKDPSFAVGPKAGEGTERSIFCCRSQTGGQDSRKLILLGSTISLRVLIVYLHQLLGHMLKQERNTISLTVSDFSFIKLE